MVPSIQYSIALASSLLIRIAFADTITVVGRIFCNDTYIVGNAFIELNDFDGLLSPDYMGETVVKLENDPTLRRSFRVNGSATDTGVNPRLEPYLRLYHGCGTSLRTECIQLVPEEAPTEHFFYYIGDITLSGDADVKLYESCDSRYCKKLTNWQVCYEVQGKTDLIKRQGTQQ